MPLGSSSSRHPCNSNTMGPPATGRTTTSRARTTRPHTAATSVQLQNVICAITESRGISPTVGLAFVNLATSEAVLSQICDTQTYARTLQKLLVFEPTEILFMTTAKDSLSNLYAFVETNFPHLEITTFDRKYWSEQNGYEYVEQLAFEEDVESVKMSVEDKFFALCCFAAVLNYTELERSLAFSAHSLRIRYEPSEETMMIDLATIVSLELIQNLQNTRSKDCLFGILNETFTPMGARFLRSNILQPLTDETKLAGRYEAVEDLLTNERMFFSVRQALKSFVDSDKILTALNIIPTKPSLSNAEQSINHVILLKTYVSSIKNIYEALTSAKSSLLLAIRSASDLCSPSQYENVEQMICNAMNDDLAYSSRPLDMRNNRTYAIKSGFNTLLDVARQSYKEGNADVADLSARLSGNLPLDLRFDTARQYYFRLRSSDLSSVRLPEVFVNVYRKKTCIEFQTLDLVKLNQKITDSHEEVISMSDRSIQQLIDNIRPELSALFRISEAVAVLDVLAAFGYIQNMRDYVRPEITDTLAIKAGRHPIREKIHTTKFVPNDAYASQQTRFQIITGCNMSGKSTYIRSLALMAVMAQIGCSVPAQYASFPIIHKLFARVSTDDNLETNVSTFSIEMREMVFILRNIDAKSMAIVDELGRGTATADGLAISIAIAEALVDSHAFVWFATHFHDLARIMEHRNGVVNLHLSVDMTDARSQIKMLYRIADGYVPETHYGLALARTFGLPPAMIEVAEKVSKQLSLKADNQRKLTSEIVLSKRRKLLLDLKEQLRQAQNGTMDDETLRIWLIKLQQEFTLLMSELQAEGDRLIENESQLDALASEQIEISPQSQHSNEAESSSNALVDVSSPSLPDIPLLKSRRTVQEATNAEGSEHSDSGCHETMAERCSVASSNHSLLDSPMAGSD
ncbi:MutS protein msh4 [Myotisia sp. PD_48]|nr:MutS protein msh4 [Myotisia sp. PD_48]